MDDEGMTESSPPTPTGGTAFLRRHRVLLLMTTWGVVIAGILRAEPLLAALFGSGHSICGVWGCGPPLSSLLVWHGFIAALTIPAAVWTAVCSPVHAAGVFYELYTRIFENLPISAANSREQSHAA